MSTTVESEQALTGEAFAILRRNLPPHKVARLLSIWQVGQGDFVKDRGAIFAGETAESLFDQAFALQTK